MGLVDLYTYTGAPEFKFTGDWGIMGNIAGAGNEFFAWERWLLGWLVDDEVSCLSAEPARVTLVPLETQGATNPLLSRCAVARTGETTAVVAEARAALGGDVGIPQPGVLVYAMDTAIASGAGPLRVLPLNATGTMLRATLTEGQSLEFDGVRVSVVSIDPVSGGAVIDVVPACNAYTCPPPASCGAGGACVAAADRG